MMFITPIPPTRSEIPAMPARRSVRVRLTELAVDAMVVWLVMVKSASDGWAMWWAASNSSSISW
jgi:hypothetical protein